MMLTDVQVSNGHKFRDQDGRSGITEEKVASFIEALTKNTRSRTKNDGLERQNQKQRTRKAKSKTTRAKRNTENVGNDRDL
eukprot:SAG31_NODE_5126_length_2725_cov_1.748286_4_plen_81_part_00